MKENPFASALQAARLRAVDFCRIVENLSGKKQYPATTSTWMTGKSQAPAAAIALAILLQKLPNELLVQLIKEPVQADSNDPGLDAPDF
jgi:hypothetical protein